MKSVRNCSDELASMVRSGRISNIDALKRGKLHLNQGTFIGHNSISKTDDTRGWLSCAKHRLSMRRNFDVLNRVKVDGLPSYCSMRDSQFSLTRLRVGLVRWCGLGVTTDYLGVWDKIP